MLVGITGYAQHGKDTTGQRLVDEFGFKRFAFADQLKALALDIDPHIGVENADGSLIRLSEAVSVMGWEGAKGLPEVRRLLIALGIGVRSRIGADAWVEACITSIESQDLDVYADNIVVTDVRFPNEAVWVQGMGALMRVTRPGVEAVPHENESERYVPEFSVRPELDIVAENLEQLIPRVDTAALFILNDRPSVATSIRRAYD